MMDIDWLSYHGPFGRMDMPPAEVCASCPYGMEFVYSFIPNEMSSEKITQSST
jgi:hypothetical protein